MGRLANKVNSPKIRLVSDSMFALASRVAPKVASTLLFMILMYRDGSTLAGIYSLSMAYLTSAVMFSSIGLDDLVVREVAQDPKRSRQFLVNTLFLRGILGVIAYAILAGLILGVFHYDTTVQRMILLQGLGILPEGFTAAIFAIFNANKKLNWMAVVSFGVNCFQIIAGGIALWMGARLEILIGILLSGSCFGVIIGLYLFTRLNLGDAPGDEKKLFGLPDWDFCKWLLLKAIPFAIIISITSLDLQLDVILLSASDVTAVGIYSAARMVVQLISLLPQAIRMVIYPSMSQAYITSKDKLYQIYNQSWYYLASIGIPITVGGVILAHPILDITYRQYIPTAMIWALGILMLDLLVNFIYLPSTRLMVVGDRQILLAVFLSISVGVTFLLSWILIPPLGAVGASIGRAGASWVYFFLVEYYVTRFILPGHRGFRQVIKPFLAAIGMGVVVWYFKEQSPFLVIPCGALLYGGILLLLRRMKRNRSEP